MNKKKYRSITPLLEGARTFPVLPRLDRRRFMRLAGLMAGMTALGGLACKNEEVQHMLSEIPISIDKIKKEDLDKEILRAAIIAELDAVNLYEQMAALTGDANLKKILLDIAREEKTHVGEFQALLLHKDKEQKKELAEGQKEVNELLGK